MNLNDSTEGWWLTPDLLGGDITNPQSLNRYAYALNNPATLTDPSGLDSCTIDGQPGICTTSTATAPDQLPFFIGPCSYAGWRRPSKVCGAGSRADRDAGFDLRELLRSGAAHARKLRGVPAHPIKGAISLYASRRQVVNIFPCSTSML